MMTRTRQKAWEARDGIQLLPKIDGILYMSMVALKPTA